MITNLQAGSMKAINVITQGKESVSHNVEQLKQSSDKMASLSGDDRSGQVLSGLIKSALLLE